MNLYLVTSPSYGQTPLLFLSQTDTAHEAAWEALSTYAPRGGTFQLSEIEEEGGVLTFLAYSPGDFASPEKAKEAYHQCEVGDAFVLRVAKADGLAGKLVNARTLIEKRD